MTELQAKTEMDNKNLSDIELLRIIKVEHRIEGDQLFFTKEEYEQLKKNRFFVDAITNHRLMCDKDAIDINGYELRHSFKGQNGGYLYFYVRR